MFTINCHSIEVAYGFSINSTCMFHGNNNRIPHLEQHNDKMFFWVTYSLNVDKKVVQNTHSQPKPFRNMQICVDLFNHVASFFMCLFVLIPIHLPFFLPPRVA